MTDMIYIHTSDRALFKRCRRKWGWESPIRRNLQHTEQPSYFWFGTGGHYALEDYHGHNVHGDPVKAFLAYCDATDAYRKAHNVKAPEDLQDQIELGTGILEHYKTWLKSRDAFKTYVVGDKPQVEVTYEVELGNDVYYQGTFDRVIEKDDELWVVDYKFYKNLSNADLDFNAQMSAYICLASAVYDKPVGGAIMHQFVKKVPQPPKITKHGHLSTDKRQAVTAAIYKDAIDDLYKDQDAPDCIMKHYNAVKDKETPDADLFIRRDYTRRTKNECISIGNQIMAEAKDMVNIRDEEDLYKNETKDCVWDCQFAYACRMKDNFEDVEMYLRNFAVPRETYKQWREYL